MKMTYLLYVKVNSWSNWMYYGMVSSIESAAEEISRLKATFCNAYFEKENEN